MGGPDPGRFGRRGGSTARRRVAAWAGDQDGVVSRRQLAESGWDRHRIRSQVEAGRWRTNGTQAIVLHSGPLTRRQKFWVAVINAGPSAALAGPTACEEFGLTGFEASVVHVLVEHGVWVPRPARWVKIHRSRRYSRVDRHPARRLPTVRFERGLIDAASWTESPRRATAILLAGIQQRRTRPDLLIDELAKAGRVRHGALLRAVVDDADGGVHALSELDFGRLCRRFGLPRPLRQAVRTDHAGRRRYIDVTFRCRDGSLLHVEIDGAAHTQILNWWDDLHRDIDMLIGGEPTIRIPAAVVRIDPQTVADALHRLLQAPWRDPNN